MSSLESGGMGAREIDTSGMRGVGGEEKPTWSAKQTLSIGDYLYQEKNGGNEQYEEGR